MQAVARCLGAVALVCAVHSAGAQTPNASWQANPAAFADTLKALQRESQGMLGVGQWVFETGARYFFAGGRHPMQSVYKLPIAMAVLDLVDRGTLNLDQDVDIPKSMFVTPGQRSPIRDKYPNGARLSLREILRLNTSESDGTACDVLLKLVGGPATATAYLRRIKVTDMVIATTELEIGRDPKAQYRSWSTTTGAISLLQVLHEGRVLSDTSKALLMRFLTETTTGLKRLRGELPEGTVVAHKTGTSGTTDGVTAATNDIGIITLPNGNHLAVAVFITDSRADEATRERVIAHVARLAWERYRTQR